MIYRLIFLLIYKFCLSKLSFKITPWDLGKLENFETSLASGSYFKLRKNGAFLIKFGKLSPQLPPDLADTGEVGGSSFFSVV